MAIALETTSFSIRAFEFSDLPAFSHYRNCPEVARYQSWVDYSLDDAIKMFEQTNYKLFSTDERIGHWFQLAIVEHSSGQLLGDLAVHFIDNQQVEIGFTIAPEHQNKGVATRAIKRLLSYFFVEQDVHRITAITDSKNLASVRLLEKTGFRREAHFVKNIFFKGAWGDEYVFAMLQEDYQQRHG
ncbi:GNAT family N-acetyltransferase [Thalassotalea atypica]|uniref:GNAT family N-acetyltransferase n=1 Tax=Thalassotalea atypica TaxID=2054316 RepID=UPI0025729169|nr:GNAT family protein [Thalassotalea atypica]